MKQRKSMCEGTGQGEGWHLGPAGQRTAVRHAENEPLHLSQARRRE